MLPSGVFAARPWSADQSSAPPPQKRLQDAALRMLRDHPTLTRGSPRDDPRSQVRVPYRRCAAQRCNTSKQWRSGVYSRARRLRAKKSFARTPFGGMNNPQVPVDSRVTQLEPIGLEPTTSCMPCPAGPTELPVISCMQNGYTDSTAIVTSCTLKHSHLITAMRRTAFHRIGATARM